MSNVYSVALLRDPYGAPDYWTIRERGDDPRAENFAGTNLLVGAQLGVGQLDLRDRLRSLTTSHELPTLVAPTGAPLTYHPLVDRPSPVPQLQQRLYPAEHGHSLALLQLLLERLHELLLHVEPVDAQKGCYGEVGRELLILAATNVESAWRTVLRENQHPSGKQPWMMNQYVKLLAPMQLAEWRLSLATFPEWGDIRPFEKWDAKAPGKSMPWYVAYTAVKHDGYHGLPNATVGHAVDAVAAFAVMHWAQFGLDRSYLDSLALRSRLDAPDSPACDLEDVYFGFSRDPKDWRPHGLFAAAPTRN